MSKMVLNNEWCKACSRCILECPKKAISMTEVINSKGYATVKIDDAKCSKCGVCFWVCPDCVFELEA